ncbi:hypothetical protein GCM10025786_08940 [Nocardioides caeni]
MRADPHGSPSHHALLRVGGDQLIITGRPSSPTTLGGAASLAHTVVPRTRSTSSGHRGRGRRLDAVRAAQRPADADQPAEGEQRTHPTDAERAEREAAFVSALAERLDDAVASGELTAADRTSVLKAHDAGVLGRP